MLCHVTMRSAKRSGAAGRLLHQLFPSRLIVMTTPIKPTVFISYSHKDEEWKNRLRPHLKMLEQAGRIVIWDDRDINGGAQWYNEIMQAMDRAAVAVCLISADYLASDFCTKEEIPYLLERRERDGMVLLPILVRPCLWEAITWLSKSQMLPRDGQNIVEHFKGGYTKLIAIWSMRGFMWQRKSGGRRGRIGSGRVRRLSGWVWPARP
jgi:hypothetical protein